MATPLTELRLLNNVDLDTTYSNTFSRKLFGNISGQVSFFSAKTVYTFNNLSFQRKERSIKVNKSYEQIEPLTYGMFKNGTNAKWYFFFITDLNYISDNVTEIIIEIDIEQTYLFDVSYGECYVEREHVSNDALGAHVVDEGLDVGELQKQGSGDFLEFEDIKTLSIVMVLSAFKAAPTQPSLGDLYNGIYSKLRMYAYDADPDGVTALNADIMSLETSGATEAIVNIFMMPKVFIPPYFDGDAITATNFSSNRTSSINVTSGTLSGYTPKNNKLFTYPYVFLRVLNPDGEVLDGRLEHCNTYGVFDINISCDVAPDPTLHFNFVNYRNETTSYLNSITLKGYPFCAWTSDVYKEWLARNSFSNITAVSASILGLATGAATGNPIAATSGAIGAISTIGAFKEKSLVPSRASGNQGGQHHIGRNTMTFYMGLYAVDSQHARIIDNFFTKYGYKVNIVKTPDVLTRSRFNYLMTKDTVLKGNIPRNALQTMLNNREKGITFWHVDDIGDYSTTNAII